MKQTGSITLYNQRGEAKQNPFKNIEMEMLFRKFKDIRKKIFRLDKEAEQLCETTNLIREKWFHVTEKEEVL